MKCFHVCSPKLLLTTFRWRQHVPSCKKWQPKPPLTGTRAALTDHQVGFVKASVFPEKELYWISQSVGQRWFICIKQQNWIEVKRAVSSLLFLLPAKCWIYLPNMLQWGVTHWRYTNLQCGLLMTTGLGPSLRAWNYFVSVKVHVL